MKAVFITQFENYAAAAKREGEIDLDRLVDLIRSTSAPAKAALPWLKLARFGPRLSPKGSLRHDANLLGLHGIELDYDLEIMSVDTAIEIAEKAGLCALVYTSPSHTSDRPRWRVLCPTSRELPPAERAHLVSRVNGLYGGIFATESWTLSQSYYFGAVGNNPDHQAELIDGECIDLLDELDLIAIGKPNGSAGQPGAGGGGGPLDEAGLANEIVTGSGYHVACVRLIGKWAQEGVSLLEAQRGIEALFDKVFPRDRDQRWRDRRADVGRCVIDIYSKEAGKADVRHDGAEVACARLSLDNFYAFMPMHNYIYTPARTHWPSSSVNARVPPVKLTNERGEPELDKDGKPVILPAAAWLDRHRPVEQMTWAPGSPMVIRDRLILEGGWIEHFGATCFNVYRPPAIEPGGNPAGAARWVEHTRYVYPENADHILDWLAHRVQRPQEKINHALVLGGDPGIGKDTVLEPAKYAVGHWNFREASPIQVLGRFTPFLKAVILRVSEAHDLGEFDRFQFYEHMKAYTAAPPDTLTVDEKNLREYTIPNCCGVVITTNHKADGFFLPAEDRRHYVTWSDRKLTDPRFQGGYWIEIYAYFADGGARDVAAFLAQRDISKFDPKVPPPKTPAFWAIADANRPPEEPELADVLDELGNPPAVTIGRIQDNASGGFADWINDRKNRRAIPHRLEKCGYVPVRNPYADDGLWKIWGKRQAVYTKNSLSQRDQIAAAEGLARQSSR